MEVRPARVPHRWLIGAALAVVAVAVAGATIGAVGLPPGRTLLVALDHLPGVHVHSGLSPQEEAIVWQLRLPRVALGLLVGAMLATAGAAYQGVFRNPLADPYLLGASAGAGLGATIAFAWHLTASVGPYDAVPFAAFAGALGAVALAYVLAGTGGANRSPAVLLLAGVAVAAFLSALQTYVQQRHVEDIRQVYSWILGRLSTSGWDQVLAILPYAVVTSVVLLLHRRALDVLSVGDDDAAALGLHVQRTRIIVVAAASLATAAAVSASGLIGFVGIIVPHTVRLLVGGSYRVILPLSLLLGGAFLAAADILARRASSPAEIPIGVITAVLGAPFFAVILRARRRPTL